MIGVGIYSGTSYPIKVLLVTSHTKRLANQALGYSVMESARVIVGMVYFDNATIKSGVFLKNTVIWLAVG